MNQASRAESIPIAIVGMACRLPGADNLEEYWRLLVEGRSAIVEMPPDRLDQQLYYDPEVGVLGKSYSKLAGLIANHEFDSSACPIPDELRRSVDAAHLSMCGVAAAALQDAGLDPFRMPPALCDCGVYIGHVEGSSLAGDYAYGTYIEQAAEFLSESEEFQRLPTAVQLTVRRELIQDVRRRMPQRTMETPDLSASMVAGTISKAFQLTGPFVAVNSACASSLQSILLGTRALQLGRVKMAIVGGASDCRFDTLALFSHARAISATGSRPFDADADGLICGEGYAALVVKTLPRALADGDRVHAVIRGLGVSSDGKGKSPWAPRKEGQIEALKRAYRTGIDIGSLQYVEAHATATQVGDATELTTLTEILSEHLPPGKKIPVASVKANIGHTLETAGIAGVIKTVLCMQRQIVPPAINVRRLNPKIDWDRAPIFIPTRAVPWPAPADGTPRRAGVNAFGLGGLNMHAVLEEFSETAYKSRELPAVGPIMSAGETPAEEEGIAVIGMGCVLPDAGDIDAYWQLLSSGRDPKRRAPADRLRRELQPHRTARGNSHTPVPWGGFINDFQYDWRRHKVPPKHIAQADPLQFMLLEAADQALDDAGYDQKPFDRSRVGVVVGTEFDGDSSYQLQMGRRLADMQHVIDRSLQRLKLATDTIDKIKQTFSDTLLDRWPALVDDTGSFNSSSLASRIAKTWNLMGGAVAIDAGEASSLAAIGVCADMLLAGDCDMMICAAGQRRMGLPEYEGLGDLPGDDTSACSLLDARNGVFIPGEGAGAVLLKRLSNARRDGDRIHAVLRGIGAAHEQNWENALRSAMERSFQQGNIRPDCVAVTELDATSQEMAHQQLEAIISVQDQRSREQPMVIGSAASQIGYIDGASGIVSLLKAMLELKHGEIPATFGVDAPAQAVERHPKTVQITTRPTTVAKTADNQNRVAAVASCGRGLAYHLILVQADEGTLECCGALDGPVARPVSSGRASTRHEIVQFDATKRRRDRMRQSANAAVGTVSAVAPHDRPGVPSAASGGVELATFLVNLVVEQTGYPPEIVELDVDLETDLGIDSIKKAQLFSALQEYFDVVPSDGLTFDDFPTLRHVLDYLAAFSERRLRDR